MTPHVSITLLRTQSDDRLVKLTRAGHDRAFEAIVDRYRRPLLRYARRFLPEGRAEDVVQAAFVSAWSALGEGVEVRDLRPWLYRIVHNGALNAMKRPGGDDAPLFDLSAAGPGPEAQVEARDDVRRTLDAVAALPDRQRAALLAVAVDGRAHADVAAELGLSDTAVRQLVRRARVSLRAAATALTPWPAAAWLAQAGTHHQDSMTSRIAEAVAGTAGTAGVAGGAVIKTGAIVATVGVIAAGAPQVVHVVRRHPHRPAPAATRAAAVHAPRVASGAPAAIAAAAPVAGTAAAPHPTGTVHARRHTRRRRAHALTLTAGTRVIRHAATAPASTAPATSTIPFSGSRPTRDGSGDGGAHHRAPTTGGFDRHGSGDNGASDDGTDDGAGDGQDLPQPGGGDGTTQATETGGRDSGSGAGSDPRNGGGSDDGASRDTGSSTTAGSGADPSRTLNAPSTPSDG
ncbi:MAG TPA: sigma-70 family RNA polymerase sigma factor [Solirubrobacteraceae bacterium]|nr:sigma-70 family RNA polymerase sigma factor [Solirubrobacteraceae bacterium]